MPLEDEGVGHLMVALDEPLQIRSSSIKATLDSPFRRPKVLSDLLVR